jgi:hypothetical protein
MPSSINDLPMEIMLIIMDDIDKRSDLAALAMVCRACYTFYCSNEVQYRRIYARSIHLTPLWRFLANNPALAQEVRILSIGGHIPKDHIPRGFQEQKDEDVSDAEHALSTALRHMNSLASFTWESGWKSNWHSPTTGGQVWDNIRVSCSNVRVVAVEDQPTYGITSMFNTSVSPFVSSRLPANSGYF